MDTRIKSIIFDEENHKYFFNGKELHGVTGAIGKKLGHVFPEGVGHIEVGKEYGHQLHSDVEHYFNDGNTLLATEGSKWVISQIEEFGKSRGGLNKVECEVTVSDFEGTASKVDIVAHTDEGDYLLILRLQVSLTESTVVYSYLFMLTCMSRTIMKMS